MNSLPLKRWASAAFLLFLGFLPLVASNYTVSIYRDCIIFALFALSLDLVWGTLGLVSFGHAIYFGIGAYSIALLHTLAGISGIPAILITVVIGFLFSTIQSIVLFQFKARGQIFTMLTLVLAFSFGLVTTGWADVTGGDVGISQIPIIYTSEQREVFRYYTCLGVLSIALVGGMTLLHSRLSIVYHCLRHNEKRLESLGCNTNKMFCITNSIAGGVAAVAGALYVSTNGFVAPDLIGIGLSTEVLLWVAISFKSSFVGPCFGAIVFWRFQQEIASIDVRIWPALMGIVLICFVRCSSQRKMLRE